MQMSFMINDIGIKANLFLSYFGLLANGRIQGDVSPKEDQDPVKTPRVLVGPHGNSSGSCLAELEEVTEEREVWAPDILEVWVSGHPCSD